MFIRKKKNKNGTISIVIIDKSNGRYKVIKNFGVCISKEEQEQKYQEASYWINLHLSKIEIDFEQTDNLFRQIINNIQSLKREGINLVVGKLFDDIGFSVIKDEIFKQLVLYRLVYPTSKLKTTEYLYRYHQLNWDENKVYRYLDKLYNTQKELVQQISYQHTVKILGTQPQVIFYDVTTVYFEVEQEDELRQTGFSKEGKHQNPQIILGLLVSKGGYPLAYDIFDGKKFEGHTLLPIINSFKEKYQLEQLVVIADAGLLSNENIKLLIKNKYTFILGARIKNESKQMQKRILSATYKNGSSKLFDRNDNTRLIVSYSDSRASKDAQNRERGLKRLEKQIKQGKLTKRNINNKGYNKYLKLAGDIHISIDYEKYTSDAYWDGLKGYITNSELSSNEIIENYHQLWQIEKAFRVSKTDLKVRPIYHRLPRRIEAHICLTFVAYKVYKELERHLQILKAPIKAKKAIEIAESIFQITVQLPQSKQIIKHNLILNEEQKLLQSIFKF